MLYARIKLKEPIQRTFRVSTERNYWPAGTEFYIQQESPGYGMVVTEGPDAGLGVLEEAVEILESFDSLLEMADAAENEPKKWYRVSAPNWTHYFQLTGQEVRDHQFYGNSVVAALPDGEPGITCEDR